MLLTIPDLGLHRCDSRRCAVVVRGRERRFFLLDASCAHNPAAAAPTGTIQSILCHVVVFCAATPEQMVHATVQCDRQAVACCWRRSPGHCKEHQFRMCPLQLSTIAYQVKVKRENIVKLSSLTFPS